MKCVIIVNPKSGKGKILKYKSFILEKLKQKFDDIVWLQTERAGHATELAKQFGEHCDCMIAAGGDGTLNEVINGVMQNSIQPVLAQIPCGTVNDFAYSMGISKNIKKSVKQILLAQPKQVDVFCSDNKFGIYICGIGVFTQTSYTASQSKKNKFGVISYFFNGLKEINSYKPQEVSIETDSQVIKTKICLMLAINSKSVAGFRFNKKAQLDDGKIDFVLISTTKNKIRLADLFLIARLFLFGIKSIKKNKRVMTAQFEKFQLSSNSKLSINFDGELAETNNTFEFSMGTHKLSFLFFK